MALLKKDLYLLCQTLVSEGKAQCKKQLVKEMSKSVEYGQDVVSLARRGIERKWYKQLKSLGFTDQDIQEMVDDATAGAHISKPIPLSPH